MKIVVASGKGGTGKTTVAVSLALSLDFEKIQLLDCDVEEPNVHLFLKPEFKKELPVKTLVPDFDYEKCTFCRYCAEICAYNAISVLAFGDGEGEIMFFSHLCHGCGGCILLCPEKAISEGEKEVGKIRIGDKGKVRFIEGRLNLSEVLAPKVIEEVKELAEEDSPVIIDAPPGTSCPVVAALKNVDFCILVTEPTPFGLHDLELAYEVAKALGVPSGVVINKSGEDEIIENFCREKGVPILMRIPFDESIARAYSQGISLVEAMPEYKEKFKKLYEKIEGLM
jgi:MinD superfamily P-loop ATPase